MSSVDLVTYTQKDLSHSHRDRALKLIQQVDDGLSPEEKVWVAVIFMDNLAAADTYLSLMDVEVWRDWLHTIIKKINFITWHYSLSLLILILFLFFYLAHLYPPYAHVFLYSLRI